MNLIFRQNFASNIRDVGVALVMAISTPATALAQIVPATAVIGGCQPSSVRFIASPSGAATTTSRTFVSVPEARATFNQGGPISSCVIVDFSAIVSTFGGDKMVFRALLDGNVVAQPGNISLDIGSAAGPRSFNFIFPLVSPGSHVVQMQYRATHGGSTGQSVTIGQHNTIVHYTP